MLDCTRKNQFLQRKRHADPTFHRRSPDPEHHSEPQIAALPAAAAAATALVTRPPLLDSIPSRWPISVRGCADFLTLKISAFL